MLTTSVIGGLIGGLFRIAPEILKWLDRKDERQHELAMFDKQLEADKLRGAQELARISAEADAAIGIQEVNAIIEATKAQAMQTGIKWVDALNALVRPVLAFQWLIFLWPSVIVAGFVLAVHAGTDPLIALQKAFGGDEKAMAASVASFWLVDRSLRKLFNR